MKRRTFPVASVPFVCVVVCWLGCAHGAPGPGVEAAPETAAVEPDGIDTRPPSVVVEMCRDASARPESNPRDWPSIVHEYEALDEAQARARICEATTPLVDVAVGLYRLAQLRLQGNDGPGALSFLRAAALELAEPFALILLGRLEFHGPDAVRQSQPELSLPGLQRDPTLAYAHAWAGFTFGAVMAAGSNDEQIGMALQWGALRIVDSFNETELGAELDEERAATEMETLRATYERRFGPAMWPDERSSDALPIDPARPAHLGDTRPSRRRASTPPTEGTCGGLASESLGDRAATLLGGRARIFLPAVAPTSHAESSISSSEDLYGAALRQREDAALFTFVAETFQRIPGDLVAATRARVGADHRVEGFRTSDHLPGALVVPNELATSSNLVPLAHAFVGTPDGFVLRWTFLATRAAVATGGCQTLALRLARGVLGGPRRLVTRTGLVGLGNDLAIELSGEHGLVQGSSGMETWIYSVRPFGRGDTSLVVEMGWNEDEERTLAPANATGHTTTLLGTTVEARTWNVDGVHLRETMAALDEEHFIRVVARSTEQESFAAAASVGASLHRLTSPLALPDCAPPDATAAAPTTLPPEAANDEALQLLRTTRRFSTDAATFVEPTFRERGAYRRLLRQPYAIEAFRHLAENATPEGRVYALAGLYELDHADFERRACALGVDRAVFVRVSEPCDVRNVPLHEVVASSSPDAERGEPHWRMWRVHGTPDLRGGGIAYALSVRIDSDETHAAWALAGEGFTTASALRRGRGGSMLTPGSRSDDGGIRGVGRGDLCAITERGSVACIRPDAGRAIVEADVVPYPTSFSEGMGTCVLDATGRRACRDFAIDEAIALRDRTCGTRARRTDATWRVYDDGPYDELLPDGCGLHRDGSLRCFAPHVVSVPDWTDRDLVLGSGASYRVPIEGRVLGVVDASRGRMAWTDDGSIYRWSDEVPPSLFGRVSGVRQIIESPTLALLARTDDGRVLTFGARRAPDGRAKPWNENGALVEDWVEVPELFGADLVADGLLVCARFETGRVMCFGREAAERAVDHDPTGERSAPREPVHLQGAREVFLGARYTCGRMDDDLLRCEVTSLEPLPEAEQGPETGFERVVRRSVDLSIRRLLREARPPERAERSGAPTRRR